MTIEAVLNMVFSIVTAIIAGIALFQTKTQIRLSNRQNLFNRRLEKYLVVQDLMNLYKKHRNFIGERERIIIAAEVYVAFLTNVSYLTDMMFAVNDPLNNEKQNIFLSKCEMLEKYATEIMILWGNTIGEDFGKFVRIYKCLLFKLYQQKVCLQSYQDYNRQQNGNIKLMLTGEEVSKRLRENAERIKLFETIYELEEIYNKIKSSQLEDQLLNTLKLRD